MITNMSRQTLPAAAPPRPSPSPLPTLTNVEKPNGPDRKSQSPQVVLSVGPPLETNHQQVAKHHGAHLRGNKGQSGNI